MGVEQHGPYTAKIKSLTRILDLVDSPWIRVNYDCGNTFLAGEDPYAMLDAVIDRVVHVHAKDISRKTGRCRSAARSRAPPSAAPAVTARSTGIGSSERLKQAGFDGVLSVECGTEDEAERSLVHLTRVLQEEA